MLNVVPWRTSHWRR